MGIWRNAPTRPEGVGVVDDSVQRRANLRVFQETSDGHSHNVVNALVGRECEGSQQPVLALGEPQGQSLQGFFGTVVHQSTMTEKKRSVNTREVEGFASWRWRRPYRQREEAQ